ncbi:ABC transporter permease [Clostridium carboxidivorans P7]|nr:FtsX-like permease family protein [Clostridium carboxidivorans]AKN30544.1 ABC transporter permease [Clostridium carboxidivorans P7]EFG86290.1 efflux ABC transporter, permease protein [Clostridium carboxidivorans P7]
MKPLSSITYLINNINKILPSFISMIFSVFLVYFVSILISSSNYALNLNNLNMAEKVTIVTSNSKMPIPGNVINEIKTNSPAADIIPIISVNGHLQYDNPFGGSSFNSYNVFQNDVSKLLNIFNLKLVKGKLPSLNKDEIILPLKYAKQNEIKVGQSISSSFEKNIVMDKKYIVCGIIDGPVNIAITSNEFNTSKENALKYSIMFSTNNNNLTYHIKTLGNSNIIISDYKTVKGQIHDYIKSLDSFIYIFHFLIIIVLSISLGNLNYIIFISRKNEFAILRAIGYKRNFLLKKLFKESFLLNLLGFITGIIIAIIVTQLLNITIWMPKGQYVLSFKLEYIITAFLIPLSVSLVNMLIYLRKFKCMNYENLNI